jgi:hypothetical protein
MGVITNNDERPPVAGIGGKQRGKGRGRRLLRGLEVVALGTLGLCLLLVLWQYLSTVLPPSRLVSPSLVLYHP